MGDIEYDFSAEAIESTHALRVSSVATLLGVF